jgi:hypothetical protein
MRLRFASIFIVNSLTNLVFCALAPGRFAMPQSWKLYVIVFVFCGFIAGCGGKASKREPTYKVQGKVTYKGQPVANADVAFVCEEKNRSAFGKTNEKGEFRLTTFRPNDGAVEGKHIVTVIKSEAAEETPFVPLESAEYNPDAVAKQVVAKPKKSTIPAKYSSAKTSDLFWTVEKDAGSEPAELELTD